METTIQCVTPLPSLEQMHEFLRRRYKHDRFEGRDNQTWDERYSWIVSENSIHYLAEHGHGFVSKHESNNGEALRYTSADVLRELGEGV